MGCHDAPELVRGHPVVQRIYLDAILQEDVQLLHWPLLGQIRWRQNHDGLLCFLHSLSSYVAPRGAHNCHDVVEGGGNIGLFDGLHEVHGEHFLFIGMTHKYEAVVVCCWQSG